MNLTNDEKLKIGNAASEMMSSFCELRLAEDRLRIASTLAGSLAEIRLPKKLVDNALVPYINAFKDKQEKFFEVVGMSHSNEDFWNWYDKQPPTMDELRKKVAGE